MSTPAQSLLPCPFCGTHATATNGPTFFTSERNASCWCVVCPCCSVGTGHYGSKEQAAERWNTRPAQAREAGTVDMLESVYAELGAHMGNATDHASKRHRQELFLAFGDFLRQHRTALSASKTEGR